MSIETDTDLLDEQAAEIERLQGLLRGTGDSARAEIERLRAFARWVIQEGSFSGVDLDGGGIQDKAVELGILVPTKYDPAVHGESDLAEPGDDWFVFADEQSGDGK